MGTYYNITSCTRFSRAPLRTIHTWYRHVHLRRPRGMATDPLELCSLTALLLPIVAFLLNQPLHCMSDAALLRRRLDQFGYLQPLGHESVPLVQHVLADLIRTTDALRSAKA